MVVLNTCPQNGQFGLYSQWPLFTRTSRTAPNRHIDPTGNTPQPKILRPSACNITLQLKLGIQDEGFGICFGFAENSGLKGLRLCELTQNLASQTFFPASDVQASDILWMRVFHHIGVGVRVEAFRLGNIKCLWLYYIEVLCKKA